MSSPLLRQYANEAAAYGVSWTTFECAVEAVLREAGETNSLMPLSLLSQKMTEEALANPIPWTTVEAAVDLIAGAVSSGALFDGSNVIYVSKSDGSTDTRTGLSNYDPAKPFATLTAAQTAAVSGDLIIVQPGTYDEGGLGKNGVNWYFLAGAVITYTAATVNAIFEDPLNASYSVYGEGRFIRSGAYAGANKDRAGVLLMLNSGTISFHFDYAERAEATQNGASTFIQRSGTLHLSGRYATSSNEAGGTLFVFAGDATYVRVQVLRSETYDPLIVNGGVVHVSDSYIYGASINSNGIEVTGGILYASSCVIEAAGADGVINAYGDGATAFFSSCNISSSSLLVNTAGVVNGQNETNRLTFSSCFVSALESYEGPIVDCFESGGITLRQCRIVNPGGVCISVSNSSLIVDGCTLVADVGGTESIHATTPVNLKTWGSVANKPIDSDITIQVGIVTVSSDVQ